MTPERAEYFRLMIIAGLREEYDRELDHTLETADPIVSPELELAMCMSDVRETISVLYGYTLDFSVDQQQVYEMVMAELRRQYHEQLLTPTQIIKIAEKISHSVEDYWDEPWYKLYHITYDYELAEDGLISEETFNKSFYKRFFQGETVDYFALEDNYRKAISPLSRIVSTVKEIFNKQGKE